MRTGDILMRGESMRTVLRWVKGFLKKNTEDHLGAYASQAAYFIVLSAFPFCIFLLTLLRYSPLTHEDLLNILQMLSPKMANDVIRSVMKEVYEQSTICLLYTSKSGCRKLLVINITESLKNAFVFPGLV